MGPGDRDGVRSSYGQRLVTKKKKKKIVGVSRLNFYFLPYIFKFFRKKKFTPYKFFFKKLVREGGHGLRAPSLRS